MTSEVLAAFQQKHKLSDTIFVPYGSRVYGTASDKSDHDFLAIVAGPSPPTGTEFLEGSTNIQIYKSGDFQEQLTAHKIHTLEAYFLPQNLLQQFSFTLDKTRLRSELSQKASHSFVKAKKKIEVEKDFYVGWKSLFHSLRILNFGIQIAQEGKIMDYGAANQYWFDIISAQQYSWPYFKESYQPEYNRLATEFRQLAPKELP